MKKHNALKVVLVSMIVALVLSWIIPAAYFSTEFMDQGRVQMGLFNFFEYPLTAVSYFGYIPVYLLFVGGFYGVLYKIPAYRNLLDKVAAKGKAHSKLTITLIVALLALGVSVCGLQIGFALFIPFLVSVLLLMGYDNRVIAYTLVGALVAGLVGTTYAVQNIGLAASVLTLNYDYQIGVRFILLAVAVALVVLNVLLTIRKQERIVVNEIKLDNNKKESKVEEVVVEEVEAPAKKAETKATAKKSTTTKGAGKNAKKGNGKKQSGKGKSSSKASKSDVKAASKGDEVIVVKESLVDESLEKYVPTVVNSKYKVYPFVIAVVLMFVIMTLAFIPWSSVFELKAFEEATKAVTGAQLFGFNIFGKLLGTFSPFGQWGIVELILVMLSFSGILAFIYKLDFNDVIDGFINGIKKAVIPAFLVVGIYTCLIITYTHLYQTTIYESVLGLTKGFNIVTTSVTGFLSGLFNGDPAYAFQILVPHFAGVVTNTDIYPIAGILFQAMYGVSMLVAPTSVVLMVVLNYLDVSLKQWFSAVWKLLLELVVVLLLVFTILLLI